MRVPQGTSDEITAEILGHTGAGSGGMYGVFVNNHLNGMLHHAYALKLLLAEGVRFDVPTYYFYPRGKENIESARKKGLFRINLNIGLVVSDVSNRDDIFQAAFMSSGEYTVMSKDSPDNPQVNFQMAVLNNMPSSFCENDILPDLLKRKSNTYLPRRSETPPISLHPLDFFRIQEVNFQSTYVNDINFGGLFEAVARHKGVKHLPKIEL